MGRRKKLNIGHRMLKDSNQHVQASDSEGIQSIPTHTVSTPKGSNVQETHPSPNHVEDVIHESIESHSIPSSLEDEAAQIEKGKNHIISIFIYLGKNNTLVFMPFVLTVMQNLNELEVQQEC